MTNLGKLAKLWTGAVAYISLLVGAGLSVAGNLADTYRVRGAAVDNVDLALAVGPPLATLLVAELFVSEWPRQFSMQAVRWVTTITVGTLAMIVSWLHLYALLDARGQNDLVAILWPLAIDGLAIMAMAKLLAMRGGHVRVATANLLDVMATGDARGHGHADMTAEEAAKLEEEFVAICGCGPVTTDTEDDGHGHAPDECADTAITWPPAPDTFFKPVATATWVSETDTIPDMAVAEPPMATRPEGDLNAWQSGYEDGLTAAGQELAGEVENWITRGAPTTVIPVVPGRAQELPQRQRVTVPDDAAEIIRTWTGARADLVKSLAGHRGVSTRTARRWCRAVLGPDES